MGTGSRGHVRTGSPGTSSFAAVALCFGPHGLGVVPLLLGGVLLSLLVVFLFVPNET